MYLHFIFCTPNFSFQKVQKPPVKNFSGHTAFNLGKSKDLGHVAELNQTSKQLYKKKYLKLKIAEPRHKHLPLLPGQLPRLDS